MLTDEDKENLQKLSIRMEELKRKINDNPGLSIDEQLAACRDAGLNLDHFKNMTPEEIAGSFADIKSNLDPLAANIQNQTRLNEKNKAAKALENYLKYLEGKTPTAQQTEKLKELWSDYQRPEMEEFGESCFLDGHGSCNFIIDTHSLTKNNALKQIAVNDNIYQIQQLQTDGSRKAELINKHRASTFRGFCKDHDAVFHKVENAQFDGSPEHCFIHSYRSFAYSYHKLKEVQEYSANMYFGWVDMLEKLTHSMQDIMPKVGLNQDMLNVDVNELKVPQERIDLLKVERFEDYKFRLNTVLANKDHEHLDYFVYQVGHKLPFACSSWVVSHLKFKGTLVVEMNRPVYSGYPMTLTILPGDVSTVILARFKEDMMTQHLFNQLKEIQRVNPTDLELVLSSMMLRFIDNLYFSPKFWDAVDSFIKDAFITEMNKPREGFMELKPAPDMVNVFAKVYGLDT